MRRLIKIGAPVVAIAALAATAWGFWTTHGTGTASASVATLNAPTNLSVPSSSFGAVHVTWTGSTVSNGAQATGYYVKRIDNSDSSSSNACGTSPGSPTTSTSCDDTVSASGTYHYTVTAVYHSWTATSAASGDVTVTIDTTAPTATVAATSSSPTNTQPITYAVVFSEPVSDLSSSGIDLSGTADESAASVNVSKTDSTHYAVSVNGLKTGGSGDGTVGVKVKAGAVTDPAGNANTVSNTASVTWDRTAPTVTVNQKSGQADPTGSLPIRYTVTFSESVNGFDAGDLTRGGTATGGGVAVTGSGASYEIAVTDPGSNLTSGTISFTIGAGKAADAAGNSSAASTSTDNTVTYDGAAPTTTLAVSPTTPNGDNGWYKTTAPTATLSATDSGGTGVASTKYQIDGGSTQTYSSAFTIPEGQHTITYWSVDNAGNEETHHTSSTIKVDTVAPALALSTTTATGGDTTAAGLSGSVVLFQACNGSGGFRFSSAVTDTTSGAASANYPALSATRWTTHASETITTPSGGPYVSSEYSWAAGNCGSQKAATPGSQTITAKDAAGNSTTTTVTFTADDANPTVTTAIANTITTTAGYVKSAGTYRIYANATDAGGLDTGSVTASVGNVSSSCVGLDGTTSVSCSAVPLSGSDGPFVVNTSAGSTTTYAYASAVQTAKALTAGSKTFTASANDIAQNTSSGSGSVIADLTAPALSTLQMFDNDGNGKVDQVQAAFTEANGLSATCNGTNAWSLANTPSGGSFTGVTIGTNLATLNLGEGAAAADTSVGSFTVGLSASATGICDWAGNQASFASQAPADKASPTATDVVLANGGTAGQADTNDTITIPYSEQLDATKVCSNWTNTGNQSSTVSISISAADVLSVAAGTCTSPHVGTVALNGNYNSHAANARTYTGTIAYDRTSHAITLKLTSNGTGGTQGTGVGNSVPSYTASTTIADAAANAMAAGPYTGTSSKF
jgi:Bacterial Ig-like domain